MIDRHTLSQDSDDDNKKAERVNQDQQEKHCQVNSKEIEKNTDEQKEKQDNDSNSIKEKIVVKEDTVINANSLPHTSKGSQMIFNNNNNTKISNLEPAGHSVCFTEAPQQQQNKSFNCFYCSKSYSTDIERITHIDYEHPGKIYYPTPEDFENRLEK